MKLGIRTSAAQLVSTPAPCKNRKERGTPASKMNHKARATRLPLKEVIADVLKVTPPRKATKKKSETNSR